MLHEDNTAKLLGLEDVIVKKVWDEGQEKHIEIELLRRKHVCPSCGTETDQIHDYRMQRIKDIASFGKNVYLHLRKRRYVCSSCGKRFYEKNNFLPRYHRMTLRKNARIIEDFRDTVSASYIARKHNISTTTALRYFSLVNYSCKELPEVLSIDEFKAESSQLPEFRECTRAIHNWGKLILNSFDVPFTNGFTEGCNNKTKVLKRVCYGVRNFARLRNRILHCAA